MLPYGTGNDLAKVLGWGINPNPNWCQNLSTLAVSIVKAQEEFFNVWEIDVYLREQDGDIYQVDSKSKLKKSLGLKKYSRLMSNYFSVGVESRVGLNFEKKRTSSKLCNKTCYAFQGLKKMVCCGKTARIKDVVEYVSVA